ncbi:hypothetical protein SH611_22125 [Geminicoccaceae bacterium 1502E]|nr:hypothetical protein [Geminicoccaceae bacterium 1502E]
MVVCFGLEAGRARRQPWQVALGIARGLAACGHEVSLVTDACEPPPLEGVEVLRLDGLLERGRAAPALRAAAAERAVERIFWITGALRLARLRRLDAGAPVELVLASPRFRPSEIWRAGPALLWRERRLLALPILGALVPGLLLRRGFARSGAGGIVYLSPSARARFTGLGLPAGCLLAPQVDAALCTRLAPPPRQGPVLYLGPPLGARGADLAIAAFEEAAALGLPGELHMLLRPDSGGEALRRIAGQAAASPFAARIRIETAMLGPDELRCRLEACRTVLLPFRLPVSEVPLVVIEAGLSGRALVVLDAPGVSDYARLLGGRIAPWPEALAPLLLDAATAPLPPAPDPARWTSWRHAVGPLVEAPREPMAGFRLVALCGADGSGKTLLLGRLAASLADRGLPHRHLWSRFRNYLSRPVLAVARLTGHNRKERHPGFTIGYHDFQKSPWLSLPFLLLQAVDQVLDILLRYRIRRGLLLADRCVLDTLVDLAVDTGHDDLVLRRLGPLLLRLVPRPFAAVVIERDPALVAACRPDAVAERHFERRRQLYRRLARDYGLPLVVNDGTPEAAAAAVAGLLGAGPRLLEPQR